MKLFYLIFVFLFILPIIVFSQEIETLPEPEELIKFHRSNMRDMFDKFGYPKNIIGGDDLGVLVEYQDYGFYVKDKIIRMVIFFETYDKPINGIKIGTTKTTLINTLGKPIRTSKNKTNTLTFVIYNVPGNRDAIYDFCIRNESDEIYKINIEDK